MGLPEAEEELTKAQLASPVRQAIKRRRLTQVAAAALMGVDQQKVSALLNGRLTNVFSERLMRLLTALGQDVYITVRAKPRNRARGPHPRCWRRTRKFNPFGMTVTRPQFPFSGLPPRRCASDLAH